MQEYTIALAENAVDNGVELRIRRKVTNIQKTDDNRLQITMDHWEPKEYVQAVQNNQNQFGNGGRIMLIFVFLAIAAHKISTHPIFFSGLIDDINMIWTPHKSLHVFLMGIVMPILFWFAPLPSAARSVASRDMVQMANAVLHQALGAAGYNRGVSVDTNAMLEGGSGSKPVVQGVTVGEETVTAKFVVNCAGGASDKIAKLVGDESFQIKPRLGDYLLLNRNQVGLRQFIFFRWPRSELFLVTPHNPSTNERTNESPHISTGLLDLPHPFPLPGSSPRKGSFGANDAVGKSHLGAYR
jgi:hypothetical protein